MLVGRNGLGQQHKLNPLSANLFSNLIVLFYIFTLSNLKPGPEKMYFLIQSWDVESLVMRIVEFNFLPSLLCLLSLKKLAVQLLELLKKLLFFYIKHRTNYNFPTRLVLEVEKCLWNPFMFGVSSPEKML